MPGETRNYVPKLQALKNIFSNPALLIELRIPRIPNRPYFGTVTKTTNIDVKVAARLADMPVSYTQLDVYKRQRCVSRTDLP